jgi:hypothetical protein
MGAYVLLVNPSVWRVRAARHVMELAACTWRREEAAVHTSLTPEKIQKPVSNAI